MTKEINTHGLVMIGLAQAAEDTRSTDSIANIHLQIAYDTDTGDIYTTLHVGQSWTQYHDDDVLTVGHATHPMSQQRIADWIAEAVTEDKALRAWLAQ